MTLARVHRLRPLLDHGIPWLTIEVGLELARAHLALADPGAARTVLTETEHVLELRPHMGSLIDQAHELINRSTISFLLAYVAGDEDYEQFLAEEVPGETVQVKE